MQDCLTTIQNVSRLNRNRKLPKPTKCSIERLSVARLTEYRAGYTTSNAISRMSGDVIKNAVIDLRRIALRRPKRRRRARPGSVT